MKQIQWRPRQYSSMFYLHSCQWLHIRDVFGRITSDFQEALYPILPFGIIVWSCRRGGKSSVCWHSMSNLKGAREGTSVTISIKLKVKQDTTESTTALHIFL